jgi:hypothetical protein
MVSAPLRADSVFAATVYPTLPLPVPAVPDVSVIHDALLDAVHAQPGAVVTFTGGPAPPDAVAD